MFKLITIPVLFVTAFAQAQQAQPSAVNVPIPAQINTATKVFISNAGSDARAVSEFRRLGQPDMPYVRFYSEMKRWGKYELVTTPSDAGLVFEIRFDAPIADCDS